MHLSKVIGWICLSTLIFLCLFILLQWLTHEVFLFQRIVHHIWLFILFGAASFILPKYYGLVGGSIIGLFWIVFIFLTNNLDFQNLAISSVMILGCVSGYLLKNRLYFFGSLNIFFSIVILLYAYSKYSSITDSIVKNNHKLMINDLNESVEHVTAINGRTLKFSEDSVYLVNFTFYSCLPCRKKKKYLEQLAAHFSNRPFRVIEIHSFEPKEVFLKYYKETKNAYHDSGQVLTKKLRITSAPYELLFDKKGNEARRISGFDSEMADDYMNKSIELITNYLRE